MPYTPKKKKKKFIEQNLIKYHKPNKKAVITTDLYSINLAWLRSFHLAVVSLLLCCSATSLLKRVHRHAKQRWVRGWPLLSKQCFL